MVLLHFRGWYFGQEFRFHAWSAVTPETEPEEVEVEV